MTNYIYINTGTGGVYRKGQLGPIGQGSEGVDLIIEVRDLNKAPVNLTGYTTITATMEKRDTGAVTAVDGTLALNTTGSDGLIKWTVSANDTGTDGTFWAVFDLTNGTDTFISLPCELVITDNPTVSASASNLLVGIFQAVKDWLTAEKTAIEAADDGEILQSDGTNSEGSGYQTTTSLRKHNFTATAAPGIGDDTADGYEPGSHWIDVTNDKEYVCLDASAGAAVWTETTGAGGGGGVTSWFGLDGVINLADVPEAAFSLAGDYLMFYDSASGGIRIVLGNSAGYQSSNASLTALSVLAVTDGNIPVGNGTTWVAESGATARTSLGAADTAVHLVIAASDEDGDLTTGAAKVTFRMPHAMTLTEVRANVGEGDAPTGSALQADINKVGGSTILSTKLTIDAGEETSVTAATPAVISDTALADNAIVSIDIDSVGSTNPGKGLKITLIGTRP